MKKKYQVFISSTYTDLMEERQAVVEQILKQGHIPAGMELFRADDRSQKEIIRKWIEESDIYILILGYRYGSIDYESNTSYTEWEYQLAGELNKPRIVIRLSSLWLKEKLINKELEENETVLKEYKNFRDKLIHSGRYAHEVNDVTELKLSVSENLEFVIDSFGDNLIGWVSGRYIDDNKKNEGIKNIENLKISTKKVYNKVDSQPWGVGKINGATYFSIPLWIEICNTADKPEMIRNINLVLYDGDSQISKMTQINHYKKNNIKHFYGIDGHYSFVIKPFSIKKYELQFLLRKSKVQTDFNKVKISFYDANNQFYEFLLMDIESGWEIKSQKIDDDWLVIK